MRVVRCRSRNAAVGHWKRVSAPGVLHGCKKLYINPPSPITISIDAFSFIFFFFFLSTNSNSENRRPRPDSRCDMDVYGFKFWPPNTLITEEDVITKSCLTWCFAGM